MFTDVLYVSVRRIMFSVPTKQGTHPIGPGVGRSLGPCFIGVTSLPVTGSLSSTTLSSTLGSGSQEWSFCTPTYSPSCQPPSVSSKSRPLFLNSYLTSCKFLTTEPVRYIRKVRSQRGKSPTPIPMFKEGCHNTHGSHDD